MSFLTKIFVLIFLAEKTPDWKKQTKFVKSLRSLLLKVKYPYSIFFGHVWMPNLERWEKKNVQMEGPLTTFWQRRFCGNDSRVVRTCVDIPRKATQCQISAWLRFRFNFQDEKFIHCEVCKLKVSKISENGLFCLPNCSTRFRRRWWLPRYESRWSVCLAGGSRFAGDKGICWKSK